MPFYQITALYVPKGQIQTSGLYMGTEEIAYAEGEDYPEVMWECADGVSGLYPVEDVTLKAISDSGIIREVTTPLDVWMMLNWWAQRP